MWCLPTPPGPARLVSSGACDLARSKLGHSLKGLHPDGAIEERALRAELPFAGVDVGMDNRVVTQLVHEVFRKAVRLVMGILDGQKLRHHHVEVDMLVPTELLDLQFMDGDDRASGDFIEESHDTIDQFGALGIEQGI